MPVAPTYPGVYIEEIPSGVRTITGVATSITAFVGYTARGPVSRGVRCLGFGDFERAFGGRAVDSPLSYAVAQFFDNGGSEAVVVRTARNAAAAQATVATSTAATTPALDVRATSEGTWGNNLRIDVDYDTPYPFGRFNLYVTELVDRNGETAVGRTEEHLNLSMSRLDPRGAEAIVNSASQLVRITRRTAPTGSGTSVSGTVTNTNLDPLYAAGGPTRVAFSLDGGAATEVALSLVDPPAGAGQLDARLDAVAAQLEAAIRARTSPTAVTVTHVAGEGFITATSGTPGEGSSIHFLDAATSNAAAILRLGTANGGVETDAAGAVRPAQTGTVGVALPVPLPVLGNDRAVNLEVRRSPSTTVLATINLPLWGVGAGTPVVATPTTPAGVLAALRGAIARSTSPWLAGATVQLVGGRLRVRPGGFDPNIVFTFADASGTDTTATTLGLAAAVADENLARYAPGAGAVEFAQTAVVAGSNGVAPTQAAEIVGVEADKSGMFALEDVDRFNIMCIPEAADLPTATMQAVYSAALAYCVRRRAFLIVDPPATVQSLTDAQRWGGTDLGPLRGSNAGRNAAAYFPRFVQGDPLRSNVPRAYPPSGAIAGLYARTDAERGVWKAPAGTGAGILGALGVAVPLNDRENGVLNPTAINVIRLLNLGGVATTVSWGARTLRGADAMTDEYKYVPVRRLALFLEESLYRGTQWVVFEPNDEPLWAQIRLNLGAFMHTLFTQGAFQGRTPREAFFVRCDRETTTQNDIDLGRVNIVVGFAPLKPAEFVIIKIQQIAGAIQT